MVAARRAGGPVGDVGVGSGELRDPLVRRAPRALRHRLERPVTREKWFAMVHPDDLPSIEEAGLRCSEEGEEWPEVIEYRIRRGGETRWICAWGRP